MTAKSKFSATVDLERNLARTRYAGEISAAEMKASVDKVAASLPRLKRGFTVLADWSELEAMELDCAPHIAAIMDLCGHHGVATIIRVLPKPERDIGINILSAVHVRGHVRIVTCETLEAAERMLG